MAGLLIRTYPVRTGADRHRPLCWPRRISAVVLMVWDAFINRDLWCHHNPLWKLKAGNSSGVKIAAHIKKPTVFTHPHSPNFGMDCRQTQTAALSLELCLNTTAKGTQGHTLKVKPKIAEKIEFPPKKIRPYFVVHTELMLQFRTAANIWSPLRTIVFM